MRTALLLLAITATAQAQWEIQTSNTTASLRGIHALGNGIAWASGTEGTVLHTTDNGTHWQRCTTPPDADKLDFRGIQAFDANTAIVMSSGKGDLSRLYKTTDACETWKLVFTNPDPDGFWDGVTAKFSTFGPNAYCKATCVTITGSILGDPVHGRFVLTDFDATGVSVAPYLSSWKHKLPAQPKESAFAASNSSLLVTSFNTWIATGGVDGGRVVLHATGTTKWDNDFDKMTSVAVPIGHKTDSSGVFSLASHPGPEMTRYGYTDRDKTRLVAVGGDFSSPNDASNIAAYSVDSGRHWMGSDTPPHGYRSAVTYDTPTKTWITVGPNGTDISTDDGRNWRALQPLPGEAPDADQHWNALSLPFAVGPHGRIGILSSGALLAPEKRDAKSAK